jgi:hypothetical protein
MSLIINSWNGRLGNNVLQILRAIHFGKLNDYNTILFNKHNAFSTNKIIINKFSDNNHPTIQNSFFYPKKLNFDDPQPYLMRQYFQEYISPIFLIKSCIENNTNNLHIHIRSGDLFSNCNSCYVPPPFSYYRKIIEGQKWDKIFVIYEDDKNPCVNLLKNKNYNNIQFLSSSLENDIKSLSNCENLCIGFGTFGLLIYFLSKNIKNLYLPDYAYNEMPKGDWYINLYISKLPNYIKCGEWKPNEKNETHNKHMNLIVNYI